MFTSVDKFIKDEKEASSDKSHERSYAREAAVNRGGNEFTDQFYSQHMRFYKGVCDSFTFLTLLKIASRRK